ncbi:MAG: response regulator, partial [Terriglobales bacterium]
DDEPDLLELVSLTLSRMNLRTRTAPDVTTARKLLKSEPFDLWLTDMRLPDGDGLDLVAWIQENRSTSGYCASSLAAPSAWLLDLPIRPVTPAARGSSATRR